MRWFFLAVVGFSLLGTDRAVAQDPDDADSLTPLTQHGPDVVPIFQTTAEIMARPEISKSGDAAVRPRKNLKQPDRENLPSAPGTLLESQWPLTSTSFRSRNADPGAPQTVSTVFDTVVGPNENGAFPPDTMGAIGPTQFVLFINGRLRTFTRTGVADGVINADPDTFFASVLTPPAAGEVVFTSDPVVKYDRLSGRWYLNIIDVVLNASSGALTRPNRILIAVSDASSSTLTAGTVWTFYQFTGDASRFTDYQSFGVDASALYVGANMFDLPAGTFSNTKGFIIPKAPTLTGSALAVFAANNLLVSGVGPFSPRGVDNYDPSNTGAGALGYFIGVAEGVSGSLMIRRIMNPGAVGGNPTISGNISVPTTISTAAPVLVPHLGNTRGADGRLDALDDRLFAAHLRNGRLWTAHNIGVNNTGVATRAANRNAARWYEIQNLSGTPTVLQAGTLFDNTAPNDALGRSYWVPSIMVSGQGHAALGCSIAGSNERINPFTTGRLAGDALGTLSDGPGGAALPGYGTPSTTAYNPPGDPGGGSGRRWGDYSYTSLDPNDDMTMWTVQQHCNGMNTYGCRVVKLLAPPPATPASASANVPAGQTSTNVTITGTVISGSGFYEPGAAFPNHISATVSGGVVVNSTTFVSPTRVVLNLNTTGAAAGARNVTITNPDGQARTGNNILVIGANVTLTVTNTADHDDGLCTPTDCTLREAINTARAQAGPEVIVFAPGVSGIVQLASPLPDLNSNMLLRGPGANLVTVRRNTASEFRIFTISNGSNSGPVVSISGLTIANGLAGGSASPGNWGGGIYNNRGQVTVSGCSFVGNVSSSGGGFCNDGTNSGTATSTIENCTFDTNSTPGNAGGGIYNVATGSGTAVLTVRNCTLSANSASIGGGIFNFGASGGTAELTVLNATLSGNNATTGGGIFNDKDGAGTARLSIGNTILKAGFAANLANDGTVTSLGNNLCNDAAGGPGGDAPGGLLNAAGDKRNTEPLLDAAGLAENGGSTKTIALLPASLAINAGNSGLAPELDQRRYLRAGVSDIGAYEFGGLPLAIVSINRPAANGPIFLMGRGVPNGVHFFERSPDLFAPFMAFGNPATADAAGVVPFEDAEAVGQAKRFYRLIFP